MNDSLEQKTNTDDIKMTSKLELQLTVVRDVILERN